MKISPDNKEEAAKIHQERSTIRIIKGKYIDTDDIHNVYAAELIAIQMAVKLFEEKSMNIRMSTSSQIINPQFRQSTHQNDNLDSISSRKFWI